MDLQKSLLAVAPMTGVDAHMLIVLAIMIVTGWLGGGANYFLRDRVAATETESWAKYPILGMVAALTVPLFLNMISSSLIDGARVRPGDYFVFAGFCLIYVIVSRSLFESVASRLLRQVDQVKRELTQLKLATPEAVAPSAAKIADGAEAPPVARSETGREALTYNDVEILRALAEANYVYGNLAALSDKTGLPRESVSRHLALLKNLGIIETRINDRNVLHWIVSPVGRQTLSEILGQQEIAKAS